MTQIPNNSQLNVLLDLDVDPHRAAEVPHWAQKAGSSPARLIALQVCGWVPSCWPYLRSKHHCNPGQGQVLLLPQLKNLPVCLVTGWLAEDQILCPVLILPWTSVRSTVSGRGGRTWTCWTRWSMWSGRRSPLMWEYQPVTLLVLQLHSSPWVPMRIHSIYKTL